MNVRVSHYPEYHVCSSLILIAWIILVRCSNLPNPSNGRVDQQGDRPGDRASYICNSGYELVGQSTRFCQNNGQWSGEAPTCESKSIDDKFEDNIIKNLSNLQSAALIFLIPLMGE